MQHSGFSTITIIILVLVLAFVVIGISVIRVDYIRSGSFTSQNVNQQIPNPAARTYASATAAFSAAPFSSQWAKYENSQHSFSFEYPAGLQVVDEGSVTSQGGTQPGSLDDIGVYNSSSLLIDIQLFSSGFVQGDYDWPERPCGEWTFGPDNGPIISRNTIFAGQKTLYVVSRGWGPYSAGSAPVTNDYYCVNYARDPLVITFDQNSAAEILPILATFEFVNSSTSTVSL